MSKKNRGVNEEKRESIRRLAIAKKKRKQEQQILKMKRSLSEPKIKPGEPKKPEPLPTGEMQPKGKAKKFVSKDDMEVGKKPQLDADKDTLSESAGILASAKKEKKKGVYIMCQKDFSVKQFKHYVKRDGTAVDKAKEREEQKEKEAKGEKYGEFDSTDLAGRVSATDKLVDLADDPPLFFGAKFYINKIEAQLREQWEQEDFNYSNTKSIEKKSYLHELKSLLDKGTITYKEYDQKKQEYEDNAKEALKGREHDRNVEMDRQVDVIITKDKDKLRTKGLEIMAKRGFSREKTEFSEEDVETSFRHMDTMRKEKNTWKSRRKDKRGAFRRAQEEDDAALEMFQAGSEIEELVALQRNLAVKKRQQYEEQTDEGKLRKRRELADANTEKEKKVKYDTGLDNGPEPKVIAPKQLPPEKPPVKQDEEQPKLEDKIETEHLDDEIVDPTTTDVPNKETTGVLKDSDGEAPLQTDGTAPEKPRPPSPPKLPEPEKEGEKGEKKQGPTHWEKQEQEGKDGKKTEVWVKKELEDEKKGKKEGEVEGKKEEAPEQPDKKEPEVDEAKKIEELKKQVAEADSVIQKNRKEIEFIIKDKEMEDVDWKALRPLVENLLIKADFMFEKSADPSFPETSAKLEEVEKAVALCVKLDLWNRGKIEKLEDLDEAAAITLCSGFFFGISDPFASATTKKESVAGSKEEKDYFINLYLQDFLATNQDYISIVKDKEFKQIDKISLYDTSKGVLVTGSKYLKVLRHAGEAVNKEEIQQVEDIIVETIEYDLENREGHEYKKGSVSREDLLKLVDFYEFGKTLPGAQKPEPKKQEKKEEL